MDHATSTPATTPPPTRNSPTNSQGTTAPRLVQRSLFTGAPPLSQSATLGELIIFTNASHASIDALAKNFDDLNERFRSLFTIVKENTEKFASLPDAFITSEAMTEILTEFDDKLNIIPDLAKKCEDAVAICQRVSPTTPNSDIFDELAGAKLSHQVEAHAIAATADEITQTDYANDARPSVTITTVLNPRTRTELFRTYLSTNYINNTTKSLKIEYHNLTDIPHDRQPREL
ncbi:hypothetical protein CYMTET_19834 [Cymbomonas tetramitiformis]|uniref:Uncharacterized protein n=1 Tax=Cymbomonas tetramitiformis TaxID=36881 RepID=A0AAE0G591_9CHLO|nr:hypothetical protein CYMTET_19834 [Cymbomonas tetramitiformis]